MLGQGKTLILSFDDGPGPVVALTSILKTLGENAIKAEFYVHGDEVQRYPDAAKMIVSRGHKIQNHSWSHPNLAEATKQAVRSQLERTQQIIKEVTGVTATKVRPPYGAGGWPGKFDRELAEVAQSLSLTIQNWDIDTEDWKPPAGISQKKLQMIESQFKRSASKMKLNVLMHVLGPTARDLPSFISQLKKWGFTFSNP